MLFRSLFFCQKEEKLRKNKAVLIFLFLVFPLVSRAFAFSNFTFYPPQNGSQSQSEISDNFEFSFSSSDWNIDNEIVIPESSHQKGLNPGVQVWEDNTTFFSLAILDTSINSSGDVTISVSPSSKFSGKIIIF